MQSVSKIMSSIPALFSSLAVFCLYVRSYAFGRVYLYDQKSSASVMNPANSGSAVSGIAIYAFAHELTYE